jgi:uncharacterized protein (DUF1800 family)
LSPPASPNLTQAIQLTSYGNANGVVANTGATLFGAVQDPQAYDMVEVTVGPNARTVNVDVGPRTGQFAVRLFAEDFPADGEVSVTVTASSTSGAGSASAPVTYTIEGAAPTDGVVQALSRMTFGPTADLYARVRAQGFEAFVNEQLNPNSINDGAFESSGPFSRVQGAQNGYQFKVGMRESLIAHSIFTERQFQEVMGQFWSNHFHAINKDTTVRVQAREDLEYYRENAFGNFEDLLLYSARSPLMSQYLDNDTSRAGSINENYAREILELHTVGVNAGYNDQDIIEVARVLTGWRYENIGGGTNGTLPNFRFQFDPTRHDDGDKTISFLDTTIAGRSGAAGVEEGEELIAILADREETRNNICAKLVQLLVADNPPQDFIDACTQSWVATDGNIRAALETILLNPAYIGTVQYQRNKAKTPIEYVASAARLMNVAPRTGGRQDQFYGYMRAALESSGMVHYDFPVPTGFPEVGVAWNNSGSMIGRYSQVTQVARFADQYFDIDLRNFITRENLETAEEVAAYLLTIATADRYARDEYEQLVQVLKGTDGIFEPRVSDESVAVRKALAAILVMPSFQLQ